MKKPSFIAVGGACLQGASGVLRESFIIRQP